MSEVDRDAISIRAEHAIVHRRRLIGGLRRKPSRTLNAADAKDKISGGTHEGCITLSSTRDLLLSAKHLFVAAIEMFDAGQFRDIAFIWRTNRKRK